MSGRSPSHAVWCSMEICGGTSYGTVGMGRTMYGFRVDKMAISRALCLKEYPLTQWQVHLNEYIASFCFRRYCRLLMCFAAFTLR